MANFVGSAIARGHLPIDFVLSSLNHLINSGKAEIMSAWILQKIACEIGECKLVDMYNKSKLDVPTLFKPENRTESHISRYLLENSLTFLPMTSIALSGPTSSTQNAGHDLEELLSLQSVNGTWKLDSLACYFRLEIALLRYDRDGDSFYQHNNNDTVWATCLALSYLQHEYKDVKDKWEEVAYKAKAWLDTQQLDKAKSVNSILLIASRFLSEHVE